MVLVAGGEAMSFSSLSQVIISAVGGFVITLSIEVVSRGTICNNTLYGRALYTGVGKSQESNLHDPKKKTKKTAKCYSHKHLLRIILSL